MAFSTDREVLVVFPWSLSSLTTVSALTLGSRLVVAAMPGMGCCGGDPAGVLENLVELDRLTQLLPPPSAVSIGFQPNALKSAQGRCFAAESRICRVCLGVRHPPQVPWYLRWLLSSTHKHNVWQSSRLRLVSKYLHPFLAISSLVFVQGEGNRCLKN